ncbi:hypothetical protein GOP47_0008324 [Adiantum capillus-veneris]|uniref:Uncharacterized protein n=1 Tax=Adiantum capillus-veneris TaxID=13818 RepID=A0A9D4UYH5_ADICA|nr:hypothetical protein GOP47_0008324 [Adiantum capillus-veneris]
MPVHGEEQAVVREDWPRILLVGPPNVGKRSVLQRLLSMGTAKGSPFSTSGILSHGWTIDTKYYTADLCISTASLIDMEARENAEAYALSNQCQALILIFDLSNFSTFDTVREWVATLDLQRLEILLCVGNKADRLPDHFAHREYRKRLQKRGEFGSDPHPEFWDFGIQPTDGSSLLGEREESADRLRSLCADWCAEHGIEYLEACALDRAFDQCISIDGDSQGVNRILGALSAHMWPGLRLKVEKGLNDNLGLLDDEGRDTDEESEISIDYERLSNGSTEPWDGDEGPWTFYESAPVSSGEQGASAGSTSTSQQPLQDGIESSSQQEDASSHREATPMSDSLNFTTEIASAPLNGVVAEQHMPISSSNTPASNGGCGNGHAASSEEDSERVHRSHQDAEVKDFEQLMMEMARVRESARLMSDSQRREMAANLALRMASLFDEDDE